MYAFFYICCLVIGYIVCFHIRFRYRWIPVFIIAICFGLLSASMIPRPEHYVDTKRFFSSLDQFRIYSQQTNLLSAWRDLNSSFTYSDVPLAAVLIAIGAQFPSNHFFMFIVGFIISLSAMLFIMQFGSENRNDRSSIVKVAYVIFFSWFNFQAAVQGVRNMIAFVVIAACAYYILNTQTGLDSKHLFVCLIAVSMIWMHPSSIIPIILIGITYYLRNKLMLRVMDAGLLLYGFFQNSILPIILQIPFVANSVSLVFKTNQYLTSSGDNALSSSGSLLRDVMKDSLVIIIVVIIMICAKIWKNTTISEIISRRYCEYFISIACVTIGSISNGILFDRLSSLLFLAGLPYLTIGLTKIRAMNNATLPAKRQVILPLFILLMFMVSLGFLSDNLRAGVRFYSLFY